MDRSERTVPAPRVGLAVVALLLAACSGGGSKDHPSPRVAGRGEIAYVTAGDLWVVDASGTGARQLTHDASGSSGGDLDAAWSPDGTRLVVSVRSGGSTGLSMVNADGSGESKLLSRLSPLHPDWSTDGTRIAFDGAAKGGGRQIYVMNADGSGVKALPPVPALSESDPSWSPDGSRIVFQGSAVACAPQGSCSALFTMRANGSDAKQIPGTDGAKQPDWSPDGTRIAYSVAAGGNGSDVFVIPVGGGRATDLTKTAGDETDPVWSLDGTEIAYAGARAGSSSIYVVGSLGSSSDRVTTGNDETAPAWGRPSG